MGITGINHITLAVTDLDRSIAFYRDILGFRVAAVWRSGAYLEVGALWLCLSSDAPKRDIRRADDSHIAFDVSPDEFDGMAARIRAHAGIWKDNRSEGDSLYFLDPDGHKLELHVGSLRSRLSHYRASPPAYGIEIAGCA